MSKQEKALQRLASNPKDYRWSELVSVLGGLGYELHRGSGSRRRFFHPKSGSVLTLHEPHPSGILKAYQVNEIVTTLKREGYL